jgi:hypothetical protein
MPRAAAKARALGVGLPSRVLSSRFWITATAASLDLPSLARAMQRSRGSVTVGGRVMGRLPDRQSCILRMDTFWLLEGWKLNVSRRMGRLGQQERELEGTYREVPLRINPVSRSSRS